MTVKELMDELSTLVSCMPEVADYEINMSGYNVNGERRYNIKVKDMTINSVNERLTFWDR